MRGFKEASAGSQSVVNLPCPLPQFEGMLELATSGSDEGERLRIRLAETLGVRASEGERFRLRLAETLDRCRNRATQFREFSYANHLEIHHLLRQMPIPASSFEQIHPFCTLNTPDLQEVVKNLTGLFILYSKTAASDLLSSRHEAVLTFQALIHFLGLTIDTRLGSQGAASLASYRIPFYGDAANEIEALSYPSSSEYHRLQAIRSYFLSFNRQARGEELFASEKEIKGGVQKAAIPEAPGNGVYWEALLRSNASLAKAALQRATKRIKHWSDAEINEMERKYCLDIAEYERKKLVFDQAYANKTTLLPPYPHYPIQPGHQNFSDLTKQILMLEEMFDVEGVVGTEEFLKRRGFDIRADNVGALSTNQLLEQYGLAHVVYLRHAVHLAREWMLNSEATPLPRLVAARVSDYKADGLIMNKPGSTLKLQDKVKAENFERAGPLAGATVLFFQLGRTLRDASKWQRPIAEGSVLQKPAVAITDQTEALFFQDLERVLSEWELTPLQLLEEFHPHMEKLQDVSMQQLFLRLFFRASHREGQVRLGAGELLLKDDTLFKASEAFISKGLAHFLEQPEKETNGGKPFFAASFFFECGYRLLKYYAEAPEEYEPFVQEKADLLIQTVKMWLKKEGLNVKERSKLHLYTLLFHSLKKNLSEEELLEIYASFIEYNKTVEDGPFRSPLLCHLAKSFVIQLTGERRAAFEEDAFRNRFASALLCAVVPVERERQEEGMWQKDPWSGFPTLLCQRSPTSFWRINLALGTVSNENGLVTASFDLKFESQADFKRLFHGEKGFIYNAIGMHELSFVHPALGSFKLLREGLGRDWKILRFFPEAGRVVPSP